MIDFEHKGEWSIVVSRYVLSRADSITEGIMTVVLYAHRSGWRVRTQIFDAPEKSAAASGAANEPGEAGICACRVLK